MTLMQTPEPDKGFIAPGFSLESVDGRTYNFNDIKGAKGTIVAFICNHCPYVRAVIDRIVEDIDALQEDGIGAVAIMPNDTEKYPDDSFENMKKFAELHNFSFPYLIDETQKISGSYDAICTPDIFGFNAQDELQYRGRIDSAGPKEADNTTKRELREAMRRIAETGKGPEEQHPAMGCSIKWR